MVALALAALFALQVFAGPRLRGAEQHAARAMRDTCVMRYAAARTAADSLRVDLYDPNRPVPPASRLGRGPDPVMMCGALKARGELRGGVPSN